MIFIRIKYIVIQLNNGLINEEAVREGVRQLVCIKIGMDETKEDILGFPAFVGQEADDTGKVDASQQSHQNESLKALEFLLRAG